MVRHPLTIVQTITFPRNNSIRAVQWILDRLRLGNLDLQATLRATRPAGAFQPTPISAYQPTPVSALQPTPSSEGAPRDTSPLSALKRPAENWDSTGLKRTRVAGSPDPGYRTTSGPQEESRYYLQRTPTDHMRPPRNSPSPESFSSSAYPKHPSPTPGERSIRALPSPSSAVYPPSAAPSYAPATAQSPSSPVLSNAAEMSIHTGSSESATSAHIADLQHQVTLKSLSLQTLRSEYASLLQKLQRLNVKTHTIEKKSNVANQEVNDLTNKNEDLGQQVQSLQEQLDESERRREQDQDKVAREKEQWMQMLEFGRRLQMKTEQDKNALAARVAALQEDYESLRRARSFSYSMTAGESDVHATMRSLNGSSYLAALNARLQALRASLEEARRQARVLDERTSDVHQRSSDIASAIDRTLREIDSPLPARPQTPLAIAADADVEPATAPRQRPAAPGKSSADQGLETDGAWFVTSTASLSSVPTPAPAPAEARGSLATAPPGWRQHQGRATSRDLQSTSSSLSVTHAETTTAIAAPPRSPDRREESRRPSHTTTPDEQSAGSATTDATITWTPRPASPSSGNEAQRAQYQPPPSPTQDRRRSVPARSHERSDAPDGGVTTAASGSQEATTTSAMAPPPRPPP